MAKNVKNTFVAPKSATPDYSDAAQRLIDALANSGKAIETAQSEFERACVVARQSALDGVRVVAAEFVGMSGAEFDEHIKPLMLKILEKQGMKAPAPHIAKIKVAFLAFAHGIEPESDKAKAFSGSGVPRDQEMAMLKRELARVKKERDFLRDAAAFFARESS